MREGLFQRLEFSSDFGASPGVGRILQRRLEGVLRRGPLAIAQIEGADGMAHRGQVRVDRLRPQGRRVSRTSRVPGPGQPVHGVNYVYYG